ncbi:Sterol desaturase/sphingolipid hydroxylase, fatty acid hydroxylase superfamily [Oryzisolibacter propanilivorax]|uniref:Sterol desaturase/sphingolipid hydroxylase, fatty acid hydroxylase superfamily n=1 Tax=Oryzisolibacter propanilivorax TaxID=1527607 RepID=A0A1G9S8W3_9BURK|nr:lysoplasmalogenase family protein [Oryzisolibacter propanilivorax]SDM31811.1 Sterol desaturase/sphingolipid hydroxylase, fatty acid hydroxylase superfamily [Oryzisolibacter propanilivorax]
MSPGQAIVLVTPVFLALMALEWAVDRARGRHSIALGDAIDSLNLGMLSQTSAVFTALLRVGLYTLAWQHLALWRHDAFWTTWYGWLLALLLYDFCYYWLHRMGHEVAVLWAAHAVHHQSQRYNLSTALRQTSSGALLGWLFYLPMALAGVPPLVFVVVGLVDLLYQFWVHTEQVGRLGWFDRWFCSPSNHRVHHAVNDDYLDRNYGGILIVWDRLFGTFREEDPRQPCVYGTRGLFNSWDPLWANAGVYASLARDSWRARAWGDKLRVWLKAPGWRPADVARNDPRPAFDLHAHRVLFAPPLTPALRVFAGVQFALLLGGVALFLWQADRLPAGPAALWFATLLVGQWALAAALQRRIAMGLALMLQAGALATATGALGLAHWHWLFKPAALVFAIVTVAASPYGTRAACRSDLKTPARHLLLAALAASLAGDVLLMLPDLFLPGLAAFLLAHLCYLRLFGSGLPWRTARGALAAVGCVALAVYALLLLGGLPAALRLPVAAYVLAIALMAARALARWRQPRAPEGSGAVALSAVLFVLSDTLLATHRFVQPLPWAQVWVLGSYFAAQALIVHGMLRGWRARSQALTD